MDTRLPINKILIDSWQYCRQNWQTMGIFSALNYIVCFAAIYSWKMVWFWPILIVMYILWGSLFRYYFGRRPYIDYHSLFSSMIPSTKILVLSVLVVTILVLLPIIPLFMPFLPVELRESYSRFLQFHMQERETVDAFINVLVTVLSPIIFYRPMFAWISSLIGRSGLLKTAFDKTKGNYWEFLLLSVLSNLAVCVIFYMPIKAGAPYWLTIIPLSVLIIYFNIVLAKSYQFFFLKVESI